MNNITNCAYLGLTLEPVHIGAPSFSVQPPMRSIDSAIARDIDGLPYIPASSIKGCVRAMASLETGVDGCDGKGLNCPQPHKCASCSIFGYSNYHHRKDSSSLVRFSSAFLVCIPVNTTLGMIWLTSPKRLADSYLISLESKEGMQSYTSENGCIVGGSVSPRHLDALRHQTNVLLVDRFKEMEADLSNTPLEFRDIFRHVIVLNENQFIGLAHLCTSFTSHVSVDSKTGSSRQGALFSVEAINRLSVLSFEIVFTNPRTHGLSLFVNTKNLRDETLDGTIETVQRIIQSGLDKVRYYGVGGKRNRGFGKMQIWPIHYREEDTLFPPSIISHPQKPMPKVFISYSSKDKAIARRLASDLQMEKIDVWLDEHKILVGDSIHRSVGKGISDCDYLIMLISNDALKSNWVSDEVNAALTKEKKMGKVVVLPAEIDKVSVEDIPPLLRDKKRAILHDKYDTGLQELLSAIRAF